MSFIETMYPKPHATPMHTSRHACSKSHSLSLIGVGCAHKRSCTVHLLFDFYRALWRAGLDYRHGTGHGVGAALNVHEGPHSISPRCAQPSTISHLPCSSCGPHFDWIQSSIFRKTWTLMKKFKSCPLLPVGLCMQRPDDCLRSTRTGEALVSTGAVFRCGWDEVKRRILPLKRLNGLSS